MEKCVVCGVGYPDRCTPDLPERLEKTHWSILSRCCCWFDHICPDCRETKSLAEYLQAAALAAGQEGPEGVI